MGPDPALSGADLCRATSERVDAWLAELFEREVGPTEGLALAAVGGYGRSELSPQSDLDLILVSSDGSRLTGAEIGSVAERIWYPIWDRGYKLGHSVRSVSGALKLAADDLDTATSLLSTRLVAGDPAVVDELASRARGLWRKRSKRWLRELSAGVKSRHARSGEVAFLLEPDLKDGRGGLRDVHAIGWAEAARSVMLEGDDAALAGAYETVLSVRVELHRLTERPGDRLVLEQQDAVAAALGYGDADEMMRALSGAARRISWTSDEVWDRVDSSLEGPVAWRFSRDKAVAPQVVVREGVVEVLEAADVAADPLMALEVGLAAAREGARIGRRSLQRLAAESPPLPDPWPERARELFVELLACGAPTIEVVEALDQMGVWERIVPEWPAVRSKPQRNAYHTFTVDRHLCEATANAAGLVDQVDRPDLLLVGALLHDIGKGYPGDHTDVGVELVGTMARRMSFPEDDVEVLREMVRHHLLLPDVAVRRDLSDPGTITKVAGALGSVSTLRLLAALTQADSQATGPAAWSDWKAGLVRELVAKVAAALSGEEPEGLVTEDPEEPSLTAAQRDQLESRGRLLHGEGDRLLVVVADRPGLLAKVTGALALAGLDVLEATVRPHEAGLAREEFKVESQFGPVEWPRVEAILGRVLDGKVAVEARLTERARAYPVARVRSPVRLATEVLVDNEISEAATVVEVRAPDGVGVLHRITRAIAELDLDIASARAQTLGAMVVDSFYVRASNGTKVADPEHLAELDRAIVHALEG